MQTTATLQSVEQQGSILVFIFLLDNGDEKVLFGDFRMCLELTEYIGKRTRLFIKSNTDWTWFPTEIASEEDE